MIDPSFVDITDAELASPSPYPMTMQELEVKYRDLENKLSMKTQSWEYAGEQVRKYAAQIDAFEEALKYNGWDFDSATLEDLAGYFDILLQREYMVEITVRFSGNVTVPMDYDIDDLENELNAEISKGYYSNSSVEIDFMEEEMDISVEEV
jgi:hypothetical protein